MIKFPGRSGLTCVVVLLLSLCAGCSIVQNPEHWQAPCSVIVDGSGSGADFKVATRLDQTLDRFLSDQRCGTVAFVPLDGLSDTSICRQVPVGLDPKDADVDPETLRAPLRKVAVQRAKDLLACAQKEDSQHSDVLGALRAAARDRPDGPAPYQVLVVSDMIQSDDAVNLLNRNLDTPQTRARLITDLAPLTPDLAGTVLYVTNPGANIADARRAQDVTAFWTELLATDRAGRPRMDNHYAS